MKKPAHCPACGETASRWQLLAIVLGVSQACRACRHRYRSRYWWQRIGQIVSGLIVPGIILLGWSLRISWPVGAALCAVFLGFEFFMLPYAIDLVSHEHTEHERTSNQSLQSDG